MVFFKGHNPKLIASLSYRMSMLQKVMSSFPSSKYAHLYSCKQLDIFITIIIAPLAQSASQKLDRNRKEEGLDNDSSIKWRSLLTSV